MYYGIIRGTQRIIVETWLDCSELVKGYPNVKYKKFATLKDAADFICETSDSVGQPNTQNITNEGEVTNDNIVKIYVDGSYCNTQKAYGSGACVIKNDTILTQAYFSNNDEYMVGMRNVAGEIIAALESVKWAISNNYKYIELYYDYEGIQKWAQGEWKTNKVGTEMYASEMKKLLQQIEVKFVKVAAHSGNKYNDLADSLAKKSLGLK